MRIEYRHNNSGGSWWLKDEHWKKLEEAGWEVQWGGPYFCNSKYNFENKTKPSYLKKDCPPKACKGHRRYRNYNEAITAGDKARFLDALASAASKDLLSMKAAIEEWEELLGMSATEEGCNCCGAPHGFSSDTEYASGEDLNRFLFGEDAPKNLREALGKLKGSC